MATHSEDTSHPSLGSFKSNTKCLLLALDQTGIEYNTATLFSAGCTNVLHLGASSCDFNVIRFAIKCFITDPSVLVTFDKVKSFVDTYDNSGFTALQLTALEGNLKCSQLLVRYGADMHATTRNGRGNALEYARKNRNKEVSNGLNKLAQEMERNGCLMEQLEAQIEVICSQSTNSPDSIQEMSNLIITKNIDINFTDPNGDTPLHLACLASNEPLMMNLLFFKANTTCNRNEKNRTLLHYACKHVLSIRFFLTKKFPYLLNISDSKGYLPMHIAAKKGDFAFLSFIFDRESYPIESHYMSLKKQEQEQEAQTDTEDFDPRKCARFNQKRGSVPILSVPDLNESNQRTQTIQYPLCPDSKSTSRLNWAGRMRRGARPNLGDVVEKQFDDQKFSTYLDPELSNDKLGQDSDLSYCIRRISMLEQAKDRRTVLHLAVANGHIDVVELLVEVCDVHSGFSDQNVTVSDIVNAPTGIDVSPLAEALTIRHIDIIELLLAHNARFTTTSRHTLATFLEKTTPEESQKFLQNLSKQHLTEFLQVLAIEHTMDAPSTSSLLHSLMREDRFEIMAFLLKNKVKFNVEALIIAFTLCIIERRVKHLELLFEEFQHIQHNNSALTLETFLNQTHNSISFIYEAVKVKDLRIVKLLLESGADPNLYQPQSLEKNLLFIAFGHSGMDKGELFFTLLKHTVNIDVQEAVESVGSIANPHCVTWILILHAISINLKSLYIKRRMTQMEFVCDPEALVYNGAVLLDDFALQFLELKWILACTYIVDKLDAIIAEYRMAHSTTFPQLKDMHFYMYVIQYLNQSNVLASVSIDYFKCSLIGEISLNNNKLNGVPIEIFDLPHVRKISISENCITYIPERHSNYQDETDEEKVQSKYGCRNLRVLDVSNNLLEELPADMFYLSKLTELDASNNDISSLPHELWLAENLTTLKLNKNTLRHLSKSDIYSESGFGCSVNPRASMLFRKRVETMPSFNFLPDSSDPVPEPGRDRSSNLLDYSGTSTDYSSDISSPTINSQLSTDSQKDRQSFRRPLALPSWTDYSMLHSIELSHNKFSVFPHDLACIAPKLTRLDMRNNKIKKFNIYLDLPKSLQIILFDNNSIKTLHEAIDPLPCSSPCCFAMQDSYSQDFKPTSWCSHHQYAPFPHLQTISFNNNQLSDFPIASHQSKEDQLANQKLTNQIKSLVLFPSILALNLSDNRLTEVPRDISLLTSITSINISNNPGIRHLPVSLKSLENLFSVNLQNLDIEGIPDCILKGPTAQLISFLDSQAQDTRPYRCLRLFFLGDEGKGKSTLLSHLGKGKIEMYGPECKAPILKPRLQSDPYRPTSGVDTGVWVLSRPRRKELPPNCNNTPIKFFCWDFAGREEYYPAYQGFLCRRSMFIVVWDVNDYETGVKGLEKWLQCIQNNVPGSSCFIVGTHLNKVTMKTNAIKDMTVKIKSIFERSPFLYPNLLSIQFLDCFNEEKVSLLRDLIFVEATKLIEKDRNTHLIPILEKSIPVNQIKLINYVTYIKDQSEVQNKIRILNRENFNKLVRQVWHGAPMSEIEFHIAVKFLHSTGYLMHFEEDPDLMDEYVINMEWLCKIFVSVLHAHIPLNQDQQLIKCGVVPKDKVLDILKGLTIHEHDITKVISFMRKFEILLELSDRFFIFPSLLPKVKSQATQLTLTLNLNVTEQVCVLNQALDCPQISFQNVDSISSISSALHLNLPSFRVNEGPPKVSRLHRRDSTKLAYSQWVRLYLTQMIPSDFWARLLSRVIADQSYLTTLQNYLNNYLKAYQSSEVEQVVLELTENLHWQVWYNGLGLCVAREEILQVSFLQLPSLHFTDLFMVDEKPEVAPPTKGEFSGGVHVVAREWEGIRPKSRKNSAASRTAHRTAIAADPSISLQLATWLLQRSMYHVEEVFDEWQEKLYTVPRSMFLVAPTRLKPYIPCPECYHSISKHVENLTKEFSLHGTNKLSPYSIEMDTFPIIQEESSEPSEESINEFFVYSIIYLSSLARKGEDLVCLKHGSIALTYLVPDILFQDLPGPLIYSFDQVKKSKLIGEGGFGKVYRGKVVSRDTSCEQEIALKEVRPSDDALVHPEDKDEKHYLTYKACSVELRLLMQLKHANILQVVGVTISPYCILMEIAPQGDLHKIIKLYKGAKSYIPSSTITMTCKQVASALAYLQSLRIVYRDLKPSNILVFKYPEPITEQNQRASNDLLVKVADYGICSFLSPYGIKGVTGTEKYMAPEMLKKNAEQSYDKPVDVYSFGLVIYCLITLESPFSEDSIPTAKQKTLKGARPEVPIKARPRAMYLMDLMRWCWAQNPKERPTFNQIEVICKNESFERLLFACRVTRGRKNPTCACLVQSVPKTSQFQLKKQRSSTGCAPQGLRTKHTSEAYKQHSIFSSTSLSEIQNVSDECLAQNEFNGTGSTQDTESDASCTQNDHAKPRLPLLDLDFQSPIHSLSNELESPGFTPIDEDVVPFRMRDTVTFVKPVVSSAFTDSQLWYGTGEGNLNLFEVLEKEFLVKAAGKFDLSRVNCIVSTGKYVWIGTDNSGLNVFSVKSHKKFTTWNPGEECKPRERNILDIVYIEEHDLVVASLSAKSLYVFAEASLSTVVKTPVFRIDQVCSAVSMTIARMPDKSVHIWCGCDNYVIMRYACDPDGTLTPLVGSLTFKSERPGKRPNIEHIWCFEEKNLVVCCVGCELGWCALDTLTWTKSVSCHTILGCSEYQARVTALTGYQGVMYVGTGCGAILVLDPETFTLMGKMHEYTDPIRVLIATESNFNRLVSKPIRTRPINRGVHDPASAKPQSLLISLGLSFQGITKSHTNTPKTLEEVVEWNSNRHYEPTKPESGDSYMLIFSLKGWVNTTDQ